jgi:hypothetical protein
MKPSVCLAVVLVLLSTCSIALGQRAGTPKLRDDIDLPAEYDLDLQLGIAQRSKIVGSHSLVEGTQWNNVSSQVMQSFLDDPAVASLGLPYHWTLEIVNDDFVNAFSTAGGNVGVHSGLAKLMGDDPGLWAAALSHETAHVFRRHTVRKYLYALYVAQLREYYRQLALRGDKSANWSLVALNIAAPIAQAKLSRDMEHDADIQGMMLMARAGYHPDFVFALHHLVRLRSGDQSHLAAFFSGHPRWETRDQRDDKAYSEALAEYQRRWPVPAVSPGGSPPVVVFVGKAKAVENKNEKSADLSLPIYCRNASSDLTLRVHFLKEKKPVRALQTSNADEAGRLVFTQAFPCQDTGESPLTVKVPAGLVSNQDRKVKGFAEVLSPVGNVLERYALFDVHFPKQ